MLTYNPGPTGTKFLASRAYIKAIMGPVGSGKSTVALFDLIARSVGQAPHNNVRRTKHIILRNTMAQLKSTVKPLIDHWLIAETRNKVGNWRLTDNIFEMKFKLPDGTIVHSDFLMMAADTPDDVRRLLSLEASDAWVEEGREVDPEVFQGLQGRVSRFPNRASGGVTYPGLIVSTNPPPMGTWWQEMFHDPPENWEVFTQPPALLEDGSVNPEAENLEHLDPLYYANLTQGKTQDWIDVYLKNHFGSGGFGEPVFKTTFRSSFHVAKEPLKPIFESLQPLVIGMDNGLMPAAVIGQQDLRGRVNVLNECYVPEGVTMGVETFLDRMLVPLLRAQYPVRPEFVHFILDPACWQRSQANELTIAQVVASKGFTITRAPTNDPERRIGAVEGLLTRSVDGGPGLLVSPVCKWLIQALDWGYRNRKQANGVTLAVPEKNAFSHIADGFQYFALHYNTSFHPHMRPANQALPVKRVQYRYA